MYRHTCEGSPIKRGSHTCATPPATFTPPTPPAPPAPPSTPPTPPAPPAPPSTPATPPATPAARHLAFTNNTQLLVINCLMSTTVNISKTTQTVLDLKID